ncbi:cytochrome P450 [Candidatus Poriferisocius sp.]|uniref:cytochrome P450 n=1 Tax=Candidatus Poriferisocius sp. TaxID=3101276 RepID=UPI003B5B0EE1
MTDLDSRNFFTDPELVANPYGYFDHLRAQCPVHPEPHHDVMMITGYREAIEVYNDNYGFSACNTVSGPFPGFPVPLEGEDISGLIAEHRHKLPMSDQLPTMDPPAHTDHRSLLMRLITPKRLSENEEFMWRLADRQLDTFIEQGQCEFIRDFAQPFALLVVADLLGVPDDDRDNFTQQLLHRPDDHGIGSTDEHAMAHNPLEFLYSQFSGYIEDRRANPRDDVLTGLATATFPDGSTPEVLDAVRIAANLFAAGTETTVRLLSTMLFFLAEDAELQSRIRGDRSLIDNFVEEALRVESPIKGDFRLAQRPVTVGGVDLAAGTTVMLLNGAANRDPEQFPDPHTLDIERDNARSHLAFGRGIHTCPGAPLARAEARVSLNRILDRMADIAISDDVHGAPGERRFVYVPTYILRGLAFLGLEFTPAGAVPQ